MAITALPTPPSRQDPTNFTLRADEFLGALPVFATEANTLATDVNSQATAAASSATAAASSATAAAGSATSAAAQATQAGTSATAAAASATQSAASATQSAASAAAAAASYDAFDDRWLGPKATAPTTDNDGNTLLVGAVYWNTTTPGLFIWTGTSWDPAAFSVSGSVLSVNGRQGAITINRQDVESATFPFTSNATANTTVIRDASGNFSANVISAVDFNTTSDANLKTDFENLTSETYSKLPQPYAFKWKATGLKSYGYKAQDFELTLPELVVTRDDGTKGINYIPIIAMLHAKIEELSAKLDQLCAK